MVASRDHEHSASGPKSAAVDLSKIKPGDEITVRLTVSRLLRSKCNSVACAAGMPWLGEVAVLPENIVGHTPKALAVWDRVIELSGSAKSEVGRIVAIDDGDAAVRWTDTFKTWVPLSDLERA